MSTKFMSLNLLNVHNAFSHSFALRFYLLLLENTTGTIDNNLFFQQLF